MRNQRRVLVWVAPAILDPIAARFSAAPVTNPCAFDNPVCFDNLSTGHREFVKWGPFINSDIHDQSHLVDSIKQHGVVAVLHVRRPVSLENRRAIPQNAITTRSKGRLRCCVRCVRRNARRWYFPAAALSKVIFTRVFPSRNRRGR